MKKVLSAVIVTVLALSVLSACGAKQEAAPAETAAATEAATEAANAEILLAQTDTQIQLDAQDEALAEILLNII